MSASETHNLGTAPSLSSLPALSQATTHTGSSSDGSPPESGLCTPEEDSGLQSLDNLSIAYAEEERYMSDSQCEEIRGAMEKDPPRGRRLTRAVTKAKKIASSLSLRRVLGKRVRAGEHPETVSTTSSQMPGSWSINSSLSERPSRLSISITQDIAFDISQESDGTMKVKNPAVSMRANLPGLDIPIEAQCMGQATFTNEAMSTRLAEPLPIRELRASLGDGRTLVYTGLRVILFVPWCVAVGGTIILCPEYLEQVAFAPGYMASPTGPRRFAHWAECALHHVFIFLAGIVGLSMWKFAVGIAVAAAVYARSVYVWGGFRVNTRVPLGDDDKQSIYLALTRSYVDEEDTVIYTVQGGGTQAKAAVAADAKSDEGEPRADTSLEGETPASLVRAI